MFPDQGKKYDGYHCGPDVAHARDNNSMCEVHHDLDDDSDLNVDDKEDHDLVDVEDDDEGIHD